MLENTWFNSESSFSNSTSNPSSLNLNSFGGLFLVTGISSTLALLVCLYKKRQSMTIGNLKFYLDNSLDSVKGFFKKLFQIIYDT